VEEPYDFSKPAPPGSFNYVDVRTESGWVIHYVYVTPTGEVPSEVSAGDEIGVTDNSGRITGPHVHVQATDPNGQRVDPNEYFNDCE
jgi:murein DD-endopeptidase MepM/ murein hydrolase activator NlpD